MGLTVFSLIFVTLVARSASQSAKDFEDSLDLERCLNYNETLGGPVIDNISLRFYFENSSQYVSVPLNRSGELLSHHAFKKHHCTAAFALGFSVQANNSVVETLAEAYLKRGGFNPVLLDVSSINTLSRYEDAVSVVKKAAEPIARSLEALIPDNVGFCELFGHSLGGQLISLVAKKLSTKPRHVVGADPAEPLFYGNKVCSNESISETDGHCVEIMHGDRGGFGSPYKVGELDYYPNSGERYQPGCPVDQPTDNCSHRRALGFYTQAISHPQLFIGRLCDSWSGFVAGDCDSNPIQRVGECQRNRTRGNYYFRTSAELPYGEGIEGATSLNATRCH